MTSYQAYANEGKTYPPISVVSFQPLNRAHVLYTDVYWTMLSNGGTAYIAQPVIIQETSSLVVRLL